MKALVKPGAAPGLELRDLPVPEPGPGEVRIKVKQAAICGTDLHIDAWDEWAATNVTPGVTVGHEFVGVVDAIAPDVRGIEVGDRVAGEGHVVCRVCRNCRAGEFHNCRNVVSVGIQRDGGFAEYVVIPATNAYVVADHVPDDVAAILDPLGNAVHTALSFDLVGEDVLITGAGPIGQMAAAIARHAGARHVVVTDLSPTRLATARQMGASAAVAPGTESLRAVMAELGMVEGFDVALEMSGAGPALGDIVEHVNNGAEIALLGLFGQAPIVDVNQVILKGLTVKGIYGREMFETWYKAVAMLGSGLDVSPVISHRFALDDHEEAFATLREGDASKVLLEIG
ncbi:MAG: L-threonine 3-dehydrogenase [Actinomycetota bacterium]